MSRLSAPRRNPVRAHLEGAKTLSRQRGAALLASAVVASLASGAFATTRSYIGPNNGNWNTAANWSPSGVPSGATNDVVNLGNLNPNNLVGNVSVTMNTTLAGSPNGLTSLTINSSAIGGYMILNETAGGFINAEDETIGAATAENQFNQSGGSTNEMSENLIIGVSSYGNTYSLSGANTSLSAGGSVELGVGGTGSMVQSGGELICGNESSATPLSLGVNAGSQGIYVFTGGTLNCELINVGSAGTGLFNMGGGADLQSDSVVVSSTNGTAVVNFSGGVTQGLFEEQPLFAIGTNGTFNLQSGGSFAAGAQINAGGIFNMAGGSFNGGSILMSGGTFLLNGNSTTLTAFSGEAGTVENGTSLATTLTLSIPTELVGTKFVPEGYAGLITDGSSGPLSLTVTGTNAGIDLGGTCNYTGPTNVQNGALLLAGANFALSANSNFTISGGTLDCSSFNESIGSLAGANGDVNIGSGNLSVGGTNVSTLFGATLTGTGTLFKLGTGTMSLTGGGSFAGTIDLDQGTLAAAAVNGIPTAASLALIGTGDQLQINANQTVGSFASNTTSITSFGNNSTLTFGANNTITTLGGVFTGAGALVKVGSGTTTIGNGPLDGVANTDASLIINVNAGTLALAKGLLTNAVAGPLNINGGAVLLTNSDEISNTSPVTINSGVLNLNSFTDVVGGLAGGASGNITLGGGDLLVSQAGSTVYAGNLTGPGMFTMNGPGTLTLTGASTYTGSFIADGGLLVLQGSVAATGFTANSGGTLQFNGSTVSLGESTIVSNVGGSVQYLGATVSNGFLTGGGTHVILPGNESFFTDITTYNSTTITQNGGAVLSEFTNGGTLNNNAFLSLSGVVNATSGIMNITNFIDTQDFTNNGVINVSNTANITNSVSDFYLGGGARMYIGSIASPGGTLSLQNSTTLEVNGALLVNDGKINGTTDVNFGGVAQGNGTYGPVNVTYGGLFQPGFTSEGVSIPTQTATITSLTGDGTVDNQSAGGSIAVVDNSSSVSTFSGVIQNTTGTLGLTLAGTGGLTLLTTTLPGGGQSTNSYAGGTTITGGTFTIAAAGALPVGGKVINNGAFNVLANSTSGNISGGGALTVGQTSKLTIASNTGVSSEGSLTITAGSTLDLTNNELAINYGMPSADTVASIKAALTSAAAFNGSQALWAGLGLTSSTAAASIANPSLFGNKIYDVGYLDGDNSYDSEYHTVAANQVLVAYTVAGDAFLEGSVGFHDLLTVAQNYQLTGKDWAQGDFFYNSAGSVGFADLLVVAQSYGESFGIASVTDGGNTLPLALRAPVETSAVPEPASLTILAGAATLLARRRRRFFPLSPP